MQAPASSAPVSSSSFGEPAVSRPFALASGTAEHATAGTWFGSSTATPFQKFPGAGYAGGRPEPAWAASLPPAPAAKPEPSPLFDEFGAAETGTPQGVSHEDVNANSRNHPTLPPKAIQVHDSYLIAETDEGMVVIDQHALHERILYEELKGRLESGGIESQRLLVPETVDLPAADAVEVLSRKETLLRLGLGVEAFGGDTLLVTSVPAMLKHIPADQLVRDLADHSEPARCRRRPTVCSRTY